MNQLRWWCGAVMVGLSVGAEATSLRADIPHVTTSFSIWQNVMTELMAHSGGAQANSLVGINQNSHTYQLQAKDVQAMQASNLLVFNGLGFESAALMRAAQNSKVPLVLAGEAVQDVLHAEHDHEHEEGAHEEHEHEEHAHGAEGLDPHVWLDPLNMPAITASMTKALIQQQPDLALQYGLNWQLYQLKLAKLHGETVLKFKPIAQEKRKVLTSHAAFAYMGRRYHIDFYAPIGGGHEAEASAKTLVGLIKQVKEQHIQAVFVENISDERLLQQMSKETGLHIQGKLFSDALSTEAPDYFSFYRHNVQALVGALH